ncbi:MAG: hypothetical protein KDH96_05835 [Candidatus Riesia sp.]|nr:hypothetical protein [Candidatus Riesia sp.]
MGRLRISGIERKTKKSCAYETMVDLGLKKAPVKRKEETKPRVPYRREEDRIRTDIIKAMRKKGAKVWRVEPSFRGKFGLGDLWFMYPQRGFAGWMEVKSSNGKLSKAQRDFSRDCVRCNINYYVVRSELEAIAVLNRG